MKIILFLDADKQWSPTSKIACFAGSISFLSLNREGDYHFPPSHPSFTNPDRCTTIDYCVCTPGVLRCVSYATMTPYDLTQLGDQRGMIIDLDLNRLMRDRIMPFDETMKRNLITTNPKSCRKYMELEEIGLTKQRIIERLDKLWYQWQKKIRSKWKVMHKYKQLNWEVYTICENLSSGKFGVVKENPYMAIIL